MTPQEPNKDALREALRDILFKAAGGITDMADKEIDQILALLTPKQNSNSLEFEVIKKSAPGVIPSEEVRMVDDILDRIADYLPDECASLNHNDLPETKAAIVKLLTQQREELKSRVEKIDIEVNYNGNWVNGYHQAKSEVLKVLEEMGR